MLPDGLDVLYLRQIVDVEDLRDHVIDLKSNLDDSQKHELDQMLVELTQLRRRILHRVKRSHSLQVQEIYNHEPVDQQDAESDEIELKELFSQWQAFQNQISEAHNSNISEGTGSVNIGLENADRNDFSPASPSASCRISDLRQSTMISDAAV